MATLHIIQYREKVNAKAYVKVVVAHPATAAFINLVQHLLQRLHGCMPAKTQPAYLLYLPLAYVYAQHQLQAHCSDPMYSMECALGEGRIRALSQQGFDGVGLTLYTVSET